MEVELRCSAEPRNLLFLRTFAQTLCRLSGLSEEASDGVEMAVEEACANVVCHAYKHLGISPRIDEANRRPPPPLTFAADASPDTPMVRLRIAVADDFIQFHVIDHGVGARNMPPGAKDVDEFVERGGKGGLGIYIIRHYMDEVTFEYPEGCGTVVKMIKYRQPPEST